MDSKRIIKYVKTRLYFDLRDLYHEEKHGTIQHIETRDSLKSIADTLFNFIITSGSTESRDEQDLLCFLKNINIDVQIIIDDLVSLTISHKELVAWLKDLRYACRDFIKETTCKNDTCNNFNCCVDHE